MSFIAIAICFLGLYTALDSISCLSGDIAGRDAVLIELNWCDYLGSASRKRERESSLAVCQTKLPHWVRSPQSFFGFLEHNRLFVSIKKFFLLKQVNLDQTK